MDTKSLRQKILDLAIRGKLVPQDPNDEPASVLLERIRTEKQQMVKDGKLKAKDIKGDSVIFKGEDNLHYEKMADGTVKCIEEEMPFEVPENWAWCRLISYSINRDGERKPVSSAIRKDFKRIYDYYGASGVIDKVEKYLFSERLLLVGEDGANLLTRSKPIAFLADGLYWVNNHAHVIDVTDKRLLEFLCFYINSINLEQYVTGSAQPKMTQANMNLILVPIPPIEEQVRINAAIHRAFKQISTIESDKSDLQSIITQAKSKILDLAIRGQLVPQDPSDEPASVLLERIRAEKEQLIKEGKIKRDKNESFIFRGDDKSYYEKVGDSVRNIDEEIPFDVPVTWGFVRLDAAMPYEQPQPYIVTSTEYDASYPTPVLTAGKSFIIGYTNETDGIKTDLPAVIFDDFTTDSKYVDFPFKVKSSAMKILTADLSFADIKFYYYVMQQIECNHSTHKRYWISDFSRKIVPLPPLQEQKRIVAAIEVMEQRIATIMGNLN